MHVCVLVSATCVHVCQVSTPKTGWHMGMRSRDRKEEAPAEHWGLVLWERLPHSFTGLALPTSQNRKWKLRAQ